MARALLSRRTCERRDRVEIGYIVGRILASRIWLETSIRLTEVCCHEFQDTLNSCNVVIATNGT
jgi:hypothetical protein